MSSVPPHPADLLANGRPEVIRRIDQDRIRLDRETKCDGSSSMVRREQRYIEENQGEPCPFRHYVP